MEWLPRVVFTLRLASAWLQPLVLWRVWGEAIDYDIVEW